MGFVVVIMPNYVHEYLFSKSAHPSMITQVIATSIILKGRPVPVILSIGKDGFFRVWDMKNIICIASISCQVT